ncbi:hypothetical protein CF326_g9133 [Tilletia indica]|nr:hypothetical protein CF326_g9133 [Tilletia indica]
MLSQFRGLQNHQSRFRHLPDPRIPFAEAKESQRPPSSSSLENPSIATLLKRLGITIYELPSYDERYSYLDAAGWITNNRDAGMLLADLVVKLLLKEKKEYQREQRQQELRNRNSGRQTRSKTRSSKHVQLRRGRSYSREGSSKRSSPRK